MSRGIPSVRRWRVTYMRNGRAFAQAQVPAINRRFALWAARDQLGYLAWSQADRIVCALWDRC